MSYMAAVILIMIYGFVVWLDSASLTAGTAGTADPRLSVAQHSLSIQCWGMPGLHWVASHRVDPRFGRRHVAYGLGSGFLVVAILILLALTVFSIVRLRARG